MQTADQIRNSTRPYRDIPIVPGIVLMGLAVVVTVFVLLATSGSFDSYPYLFLLPWIFGLSVVMAVPSVIIYYQGRFSLANPIVFATISYFFPAFVVGGIFLVGGWSQPSFLSFIQDAHYDLPLTVVLVGMGFAGLATGYLLPVGAKIGGFIARKLPAADYSPMSLFFPAVLLMIFGFAFLVLSFTTGGFGYQGATKTNSYDGLIQLSSRFSIQATVLLWMIIFRQKRMRAVYLPIILLIVAISVGTALFGGNRSGLVLIPVPIVLAYILSGRRIKLKQTAIIGVLLPILLILGMIYGTTFRSVKGTEEQQSSGQYAENVLETFDEIGRTNVSESVSFGFSSLAERVDILSTLAVVVSNYEQLKPYEEAYGIDNNIWIDSTTFFIPRVLWEDKPVASDPRRFSDLYFNFNGSSFAITPIGDLLRNYGIIGVPVGMALLGFVLRLFYSALVEDQRPVIWRLNLYFMLLISVSYEAFYATILPNFFKYGLTAVIGLLLVNLIAKKMDGGRTTT